MDAQWDKLCQEGDETWIEVQGFAKPTHIFSLQAVIPGPA
jgi:hypothetical protein